MKKINLANNRGEMLVDDDDYEMMSRHSWYLHDSKRKSRYAAARVLGYNLTAHRCVMRCLSREIDHIDNNGLNNQKSNLRFVTAAENHWNQDKARTSGGGNKPTSKYKGVFWYQRYKLWEASISANRKRYKLGHFKDEDDAARAYDAKALELHGKFARLNFP